MNEDKYTLEQYTDFMLKLYRGAVVPKESPNFNNNRVEIEIYSSLLDEIRDSKININGKEYNIKSQNLLNRIKEFVTDNLDILINWSKHQNHYNLDCNAYDGGVARTIKVKYGQLTIFVNGQVRDIGQLCDEFIENVVTLIVDECEKTDEELTHKDKFIYKSGELKIAKTQCDLCIYNDIKNIEKCEQYTNGKPNEIITNQNACWKMKRPNQIEL